MKRKYIGQWVVLNFNGVIKRARIIAIEFHKDLKKPVFHLVSQLGNAFCLTREELKDHEIIR